MLMAPRRCCAAFHVMTAALAAAPGLPSLKQYNPCRVRERVWGRNSTLALCQKPRAVFLGPLSKSTSAFLKRSAPFPSRRAPFPSHSPKRSARHTSLRQRKQGPLPILCQPLQDPLDTFPGGMRNGIAVFICQVAVSGRSHGRKMKGSC